MAGSLDTIDEMPLWQRFAVFIMIAAVIVAGWYFVLWTEALDKHATAGVALNKSQASLTELETRKNNFLQEQLAHEKREAEFGSKMEVLPMSASTIDNLSQTLQQQAVGGFLLESWTPDVEEKQDFYARLPVRVEATGTWAQTAEFFRRVSALKQIVSIENVSFIAERRGDDLGGHPSLSLKFEVATYRFLSDDERSSKQDRGGKRKKSKRKGKK